MSRWRNNHQDVFIGRQWNEGLYPQLWQIYDIAKFNETQNELSNYIIRSSEKGGPDVVKAICDLKTEDIMLTVPTETEKTLPGIEKDVWMDDY